MKRVRIMLAATALVAVIGSSLAFTAKKSDIRVYQKQPNNSCILLSQVFAPGATEFKNIKTTENVIGLPSTTTSTVCTTTLLLDVE